MLVFYPLAAIARDLFSPPATEVLVAAVPALFPPQYQLDEHGKPQGFAIDIMNEVARRADLHIYYRVEEKWPDVFDALRNGHADLIPNIGISIERQKDYIFSNPIETTAIGIVVRKSTNDVQSLEDLKGRRVSTVRGNIAVNLLEQHPEIDLQIDNEVERTLLALLSSDVDAIVYPLPWVHRIARRAGLGQYIKTVGEPLYEVKRAIAMRKNDTMLLARVNEAVKSLIATEQYRQIYQKWYGQPQAYWTTKRVSGVVFGVILVVMIVMGIWHYLSVMSVSHKLKKSLEQHKLARNSLREYERQLQGFMFHSNAIIFIKDLDGRYLLVNRQFDHIINLGRESGIGKTDYDFFTKEAADILRETDRLVVESCQAQQTEETIAGKVYLFVKYCLYNEEGEPYALGGMATDISKRVFAERRLRKSEERYRQLVESLSDEYFFYAQNINAEYTYLSPSITNILGYSEGEFETHWKKFITNNPLNSYAEEMLQYTLSGKHAPAYGLEILHKNGQRRQLEVFSTPLKDDDGSIVGSEGIVHDVTERTKAEEKLQRQEYELREILDSMIDGVISFEETGVVSRFNRAAEKMFGYLSGEIIGKNISVLIPKPDNYAFNSHLNDYLKAGEEIITGVGEVVIAKRRDGGTFPMRLLLAELPVQENGLRRFIVSCIDVTDQQLQEEQLRRSSKMDALGKLTGGIAHDYNNMLGVILGYCEMLEGAMENDRLLKYVKEIYRAGERGAKLTRRLLAFSRRQVAEAEVVDINELLDGIQLMLEKSLLSRISLKYVLKTGLWPVWLDAGDLEDAVLNMCINAMHSISKEGTLTISTHNISMLKSEAGLFGLSVGDYVEISLADTGKGMDEETRGKVFDPFFSTKGDKGTGLGLSQVYGFVQQAGGAIDVQSQLNVGTCFTLYFPRYINSETPEKVSEDLKPHGEPGMKTILVVDDEEALRKMTTDILENHGYKVLKAENAEMALEILNEEHADLVLSDVIMMPGMDGYQLASIIKTQFSSVKVQLMSGFTGNNVSKYFDDDLQKKLIEKPFSAKELLQRIGEL